MPPKWPSRSALRPYLAHSVRTGPTARYVDPSWDSPGQTPPTGFPLSNQSLEPLGSSHRLGCVVLCPVERLSELDPRRAVCTAVCTAVCRAVCWLTGADGFICCLTSPTE
ncbi:hypothetical protein DPEC_G00193510 [Dallia pectoralis]|uniref:Uncharacterized protein n=1 Tax=Dallia pectoralis TaxID=75939 RepID=A0ACC2G6Y2_DALPE|nr:hypothetical protein DPEC_G00193510 [Dallia pectoralis]